MIFSSVGKIVGSAHINPGQPGKFNCQDAYAVRAVGDSQVFVLADGCGSQPYSEVGADIGANITANLIAADLQAGAEIDWDGLPNRILDELDKFVTVYNQGNYEQALVERFMFTLVVGLIHNNHATVMMLGDGFVLDDDSVCEIALPLENTPPYLAYRRFQDSPYVGDNAKYLQFVRLVDKPVSEIKKTLVLATDGLKQATLDDIHHPGLLAQETALQCWLNSQSIETVENGQIKPGSLTDDTTVIILRTEEAQDKLVEARSAITQMKEELTEFIDHLCELYTVWRGKPLKKDKQEAEVEQFRKDIKAVEEQVKAADMELDCQTLLKRLNEALTTLASCPPEKEYTSYSSSHYTGYLGSGRGGDTPSYKEYMYRDPSDGKWYKRALKYFFD